MTCQKLSHKEWRGGESVVLVQCPGIVMPLDWTFAGRFLSSASEQGKRSAGGTNSLCRMPSVSKKQININLILFRTCRVSFVSP
jgi:hypothetical protein